MLGVLAVAAGVAVFRVDSMARATYALAVSFTAVGLALLLVGLDYIGVVVVLMMVLETAVMAVYMVMFMGMNPGDPGGRRDVVVPRPRPVRASAAARHHRRCLERWRGVAWLADAVAVNTLASLFYYLRWIAPAYRSGATGSQTGAGTLAAPRPWAANAAIVAAAASLALCLAAGGAWALADTTLVR